MIGVSGLKYLSDEDVRELAEFMVYLINTGYEDGFHAGLAEMRSYNADVAQLVHAAPSTEH